jgi:hypothetical protein
MEWILRFMEKLCGLMLGGSELGPYITPEDELERLRVERDKAVENSKSTGGK